MATWPATLPAPLVDGYALNPVGMTARTEMEAGPARVRRRSSARVDMVPVRWSMTDEQMAIFRAWIDAPFLGNAGASWFSVNLLLGEGGFQTVEARFSGIWQAAYIPHMRWEVQATLEIRHAPAPRWYYHETLEIPSLDLNFSAQSYSYYDGLTTQEPSNPFASFITFTRSTTASYFGADGLLKTAAINEPRIEYDPISGECKGLLIEEQRTNLLTRSQEFDDAYWNKNTSTVTANAAIAPDGTLSADLVARSGGGPFDNVNRSSIAVSAGTSYTGSIFVKAGNVSFASMTLISGTTDVRVQFDLTARTSNIWQQSGTHGGYFVQDVGGGWFRVGFWIVAQSTTLQIALYPGRVGVSELGSIYIWGAQLEEGSFPTSYIKTEASAVTRGADNASVTGLNFSSWYRQDEGSFRSIFKIDKDPSSAASVIFGVAVDSFSDTMYVERSSNTSNVAVIVRFGGSSEASYVVGQIVKNKSESLSVCYKTNDIAASLNGGQVYTDASARIPTVNRLSLGIDPWGLAGAYLNGHISRLTYWPKRLTNARLQELTT